MNCRWKDKNGIHLYDSFIPEVDRPVTAHDEELPEPQPGAQRKQQRDDRLTRVLFITITTTVTIYINGSPIFGVFT